MCKRLYNLIDYRMQARLDRIRYTLGLLPRVAPQAAAHAAWLPQPYRAALVISADFELAWAWQYANHHPNPLELAHQMALRTRRNLPGLLNLFDRHSVPVTWATIGHLFLDHCDPGQEDGWGHAAMPRPPHFEGEYWRFQSVDWYVHDPCRNLQQAPDWYAPDLIRAILSTKMKHEIACHTFSHIDCTDEHCPPALMEAELAECQRLAAEWGLELRSFVFPGNREGNWASLSKAGFRAYRHASRHHLGFPRQDAFGLWQIPGGLCWEKPAGWAVEDWVKALCHCIDRALETRTVVHFWFHPSCEEVNTETVFPAVLNYVQTLRDSLWLTTMGRLAGSAHALG